MANTRGRAVVQKGDMVWTARRSAIYPVIGFFAGLLGGMLGCVRGRQWPWQPACVARSVGGGGRSMVALTARLRARGSIGGGMIISPVLLEINIEPRVASATTAMTVLISSSAAALQYISLNLLLYDFAGWYFALGIIATFVGQTFIAKLMKKYERTSIVIFSVAILVLVALVMMITQGVITIAHDASTGQSLGLQKYC